MLERRGISGIFPTLKARGWFRGSKLVPLYHP